MVSIFCATAALLYADQNLMAPNLTAIAQDFGFDDKERDKYLGGYVAAGFYLVGAPAALLFGYLSDTVNRRNLLFAAVLLGEGPCILTYFVTSFWQLFVLRLLTGISLGGTFPLVFSLLGDLYEPQHRAGISAVVQVATGVGLALGQGISGFVGSSVGWRWPFVIVAIPAIALATLMLLTTEEPVRGSTEAALQQQWDSDANFEYSERITWTKVGRLVRIPTNILVISQGLPGCLPWGMLLTFLNDYLAQDKGLKVTTATTIVLAVGIGGGVGVIGGGIIGQKLYNREKWTMPVFIGICTMIGAAPMWFIVNADVASMLGATFFMAVLTGIMSSTVGPNMRAMMMNVNEPETRGVALALQTMLDDLGKGLGPALVAVLISSVGRTAAFNISTAGWIPCGLLLLSSSVTLAKDEAAMQQRLKASISRMSLASRDSSRAASTLELADFRQQQQQGYDLDLDLDLPPLYRDGPMLRPTKY
jgi:predicted MFS family arabinose efflux permease